MLQQNQSKKNRSILNSATVQTEQKLVVTRDNPLYYLDPSHPEYSTVIRVDTSILDTTDSPVITDLLENAVNNSTNVPYNPSSSAFSVTNSLTDMSKSLFQGLSAPTGISLGDYRQETGLDGSIKDIVTINFLDAM